MSSIDSNFSSERDYECKDADRGHTASHIDTVTHAAALDALSALNLEDSLVIESPTERVLSLFSQNRLLARATDPEVLNDIDADSPKLGFKNHRREIDAMSKGDLKNVSCTLLVPKSPVSTYKSYGFLMNGKTSDILHAATHDICSCTNADGTLNAPQEAKMSLDDLVRFIKSASSDDIVGMNEVNANFTLKDLMGIFVCPNSGSRFAEVLVLQKMIEKEYGIELPIFVYDPQKGKLEPYTPTSQEKFMLLLKLRGAVGPARTFGVIVAQLVAPYFGFSVSDSGKIDPIR